MEVKNVQLDIPKCSVVFCAYAIVLISNLQLRSLLAETRVTWSSFKMLIDARDMFYNSFNITELHGPDNPIASQYAAGEEYAPPSLSKPIKRTRYQNMVRNKRRKTIKDSETKTDGHPAAEPNVNLSPQDSGEPPTKKFAGKRKQPGAITVSIEVPNTTSDKEEQDSKVLPPLEC
ncbi:MAG: hypothetical protein ACRCWH_07110 [Aeromonas veronii]